MKFNKNLFFKLIIVFYWGLNYISGSLDGNIERFSPVYFLFTMPIALYLVLNGQFLFKRNYDKRSIPLVLLSLFVTVVSVLRFDLNTLVSTNLLLWTIIVVINSKVTISHIFINRLFLLSILGSILSYHLSLNEYGYFPKFTSNDLMIYGDVGWRISLFPLLPESAVFCLLVIAINFLHNKNKISRNVYLSLAGYFLIFSGLRTGVILFAFFLLFIFCANLYKFDGKSWFFYSFNIGLLAVFVIVLSFQSLILYLNNFDNEFMNQLLFKSPDGIASKKQLYDTVSRLWIWEKHLSIFKENPLFGVGTFELKDYVENASLTYQKSTGSESFFTSMLARIGVAALLFYSFLLRIQKKALLEQNKLVYFIVLSLMIIMISYGSFLTPYNFLFLICLGLLNNKLKKCH